MTSNSTVLVVEDDRSMCELLEDALPPFGFDVRTCRGVSDAVALLGSQDVDCVLTDLNLGGTGGLELCRWIGSERDLLPVVVLTAFGSLDTAVGALRAGAYDFLTKPVDVDMLAATLQRAVAHGRVRARLEHEVPPPLDDAASCEEILGSSPVMQRLRRQVSRIAPTDTTVLITGESGTGKELLARVLHQNSRRRTRPFVAVNCAALPEALLESELFGHARGAFTDARGVRRGLVPSADGGTLFLDEIGELPLTLQPKILRMLQERVVRPVGSDEEIPVEVRVIAATNTDLPSAVAAGKFREDLYYRLDVIHLEAPPLRDRDDDVLILAKRFVEQQAKRTGKAVTGLTPAAAERLVAYQWPGNVRELFNCIERAVAFADHERVGVDDLPPRLRTSSGEDRAPSAACTDEPLSSLDTLERRHIMKVLETVGGNKTLASQILGVDRKTLYRKLASYRAA